MLYRDIRDRAVIAWSQRDGAKLYQITGQYELPKRLVDVYLTEDPNGPVGQEQTLDHFIDMFDAWWIKLIGWPNGSQNVTLVGHHGVRWYYSAKKNRLRNNFCKKLTMFDCDSEINLQDI